MNQEHQESNLTKVLLNNIKESKKRDQRVSWKKDYNELPYMTVSLNEDIATAYYPINQFYLKKQRLGIHVYSDVSPAAIHPITCEDANIHPITSEDANITLLFLGRIFYQDFTGNDESIPNTSYLISIYREYGIDYLLNHLQGVFSFILLDQSCHKEHSNMYVVTDPFGLIPMYYYHDKSTNISPIHFSSKPTLVSTENEQNQIHGKLIPAASICKLTYTNKVSSMWTFDPAEITYDFCSKKWEYPKVQLRSKRYRILSIGKHPFHYAMNDHEDEYHLPTKTLKYLASKIFNNLINAFQKRLICFRQSCIVCIGSTHDPEFVIMKKIFNYIIDSLTSDETTEYYKKIEYIYVDEINPETINYIELRLDQLTISGHESTTNTVTAGRQRTFSSFTYPITVFMSSGLLLGEMKCVMKANEKPAIPQRIMNYDAEFYKLANSIVDAEFIENRITPFNEKNILVEFPFLEEYWLSYYLAILPKIRYLGNLMNYVQEMPVCQK